MCSENYKPTKLFTVEQANAMLPLVRAIATDLAELSRDVIDRRQRIAQLMNRDEDEVDPDDPYKSELAHVRDELDKDTQRLQEFVEELRQLGVEPKSAPEGLVDFPSRMDGRVVFLCWKLGEPEVLYWHELDAGFLGRQPLAAGTVADGIDSTDPGASGD